MRNKKRFSEIGNILQSKVVQPGETIEIFNLKMPKNYIGFLYYMGNDSFPMKLNIDGEEINIDGIISPIDSPKLYDPPFIVKDFIKVSAKNETEEEKTISFYADGIAYSVLTISEETLISEMKTKMSEAPPIVTEEARPTTAHIINHNLNEANKWYEIKTPRDAIVWQIRARGRHEIQYSYSPAHQTFMTLASGDVLSADTAQNSDINAIYVMSEEGNVVVELEVWRR